jgi:hypothetical protein
MQKSFKNVQGLKSYLKDFAAIVCLLEACSLVCSSLF